MVDGQPIATEFDSTTNALINSIRQVGVTNETLDEDMQFFVDLFGMVSSHDTKNITTKRTTEVMDCAFLGLIYHRHMPWTIIRDGQPEESGIPPRAENDYVFTLNQLTTALIRQQGVSAGLVMMSGLEGAALVRSHLRDLPDDMEDDHPDRVLARQFVALGTLGMMIHRCIPMTDEWEG